MGKNGQRERPKATTGKGGMVASSFVNRLRVLQRMGVHASVGDVLEESDIHVRGGVAETTTTTITTTITTTTTITRTTKQHQGACGFVSNALAIFMCAGE
jgi:hypothetical protein